MFYELGRQYTYMSKQKSISLSLPWIPLGAGITHSFINTLIHLEYTHRGERERDSENRCGGISLPWIQLQMEDLWDWPNLLRTGLPSSVPILPNLIVFVNIWNNRLRPNLCPLLGGQGNRWQPNSQQSIKPMYIRRVGICRSQKVLAVEGKYIGPIAFAGFCLYQHSPSCLRMLVGCPVHWSWSSDGHTQQHSLQVLLGLPNKRVLNSSAGKLKTCI